MTIGILCEGEYDFGPLKAFVEKIFLQRLGIESETLSFIQSCAHGQTLTRISVGIVRLREELLLGEPSADFIVLHSDLDGKHNARADRIGLRDSVQREFPGLNIALALPDPHLEEWFFAERDSLLNYFNFEGDFPSIQGKDPKARFKNLIKRYGDITLTNQEIYLEIANLIDIEKLSGRDRNFRYFLNDLIATHNTFHREKG